MKGKDIKCPTCGAGVVDIDPEFELTREDVLGLTVTTWAVDTTCSNGHKFIIGVRDEKKGMESLPHD